MGSVAAAAMVARSIVNDFLPHEIHEYIFSSIHSIFGRRFSSEITMIIEEFSGLETNLIFEAAELYIGARTIINSSSSKSALPTRIKVYMPECEKQIMVNIDRNEEIIDEFQGIQFRWMLHCDRMNSENCDNPRDMNATLRAEVQSFHLTLNKKYIDIVISKYIPHIIKEMEDLKQQRKTIKIFSKDGYRGSCWESVSLNQPATFETLAMESGLKEMIIEDLGRFLRRKEYFRRVGKAWKRGYLLYGPPGTGKSSLIAAMTNYLNFDIYDLQLSGIDSDVGLREALLGTANKSIVVVEDIDCSVEFKDREDDGRAVGYSEKQVTLSGLLNFIDGLWSSCGEERIIIFTTNHKDKLDPALLRPGRMDLHIHMSYCTSCGFKVLAKNYLGIQNHELFLDVESLIEEAEVTPAEVAEQLMRHDDVNYALKGLVEFLKLKIVKKAEEKVKKLEDESKSESEHESEHESNAAYHDQGDDENTNVNELVEKQADKN
ncbi:hypothetical protein BVRB_6g129250 [Beta vulgaris subsp. vulgaris]|nr:hypothetical protein BVRB_6g129250 [Beta vulgaris subsp. vulgaris]